MKTKLIYCDGDSWTAGDMINPKLKHITDVNHSDNSSYRLPKVWPSDLEKLTNIKVINNSRAGSSNDGIVRRVIDNISYLTEKNESKDLFVIIGFSSPERKDFYYRSLDKHRNWWETMYPNQLDQKFDYDPKLLNFYETYIKVFWNPEEYIRRYIEQILFLHYFLKGNNIKHKFFNAFYEEIPGEESPFKKAVSGIGLGMFSDMDVMDDLTSQHTIHKSTIQKFSKIYKDIFIEESFRNHIRKKINATEEEWIRINGGFLQDRVRKYFEKDGHHPNRESHKLWAKFVYENIEDLL